MTDIQASPGTPACIMAQGLYLKANGEMPCWDDVGEDLILRKLDMDALAEGRETNLSGFDALVDIRTALMQGRSPHPGLCERCAVRDHGMPVRELRPTTLEVLHVEPSFLCHLSCPQCIPAKLRRSIKSGPYHLDPAAYEGFLSQLKREGVKAIRLVIFEGRGDPLTNKHMGKLVSATKAHYPQANTSITTHGSYPYRPWILDCGLDLLRMSVDGAFPESYAKYRVGGRLDFALKLMADVRDEKHRTGRSLHVEWKYILFEWNDSDEELAHAARLAEDLEVRLRFCRTHSEGRSVRFPDAASVEAMIARLAPQAAPDLTFQLKDEVSHVGVVRSDQVAWVLGFALEREKAGDRAEALRSLSEAVSLDPGLSGETVTFASAEEATAQLPGLLDRLTLPETAAGLAPLVDLYGGGHLTPRLLARYLELAPAASNREAVQAVTWAREALEAQRHGRPDEVEAAVERLMAASSVPEEATRMERLLACPSPGAVSALANLHQMRGEPEAAAALFRRYLELAPNAPDAARVQDKAAALDSEAAGLARSR